MVVNEDTREGGNRQITESLVLYVKEHQIIKGIKYGGYDYVGDTMIMSLIIFD